MMRKISLLIACIFLSVNLCFAVDEDIDRQDGGEDFYFDEDYYLGDDFDETVLLEEEAPPDKILTERISLDLRNTDIVEALKFLAVKAKINIIATKKVAGRVTLMVEDALIKDMFDIMLRSNELAYVKQGNIYNIMTEAEYRLLYGHSFFDNRQIKTFRLKYAIPEQAFVVLDTLKSDIGRVLVEPDSGTVLIMDTPDKIKEIEAAIAKLEEKNEVRVFTLKYANAKDVEERLKTQLDQKKVGSVRADERLNQVIVQALSDRMDDIEMLIEALDRKTKEVLIDTKIVKVKLEDDTTSGIEWEGLFNINEAFGTTYLGSYPFSDIQDSGDGWSSRESILSSLGGSIGSYPFSGTTSTYSASSKKVLGEQIHIGLIDKKRDFDTIFKYLQTLGNTQIISNPKLAVINGQEARIHVGEREAYVTTTTTTGQTTTTISEEVTFVDVGIQLAVTPQINDDGYITLKVKPEISSVVSTLTTPTDNEIPIIDTSMAETTVLVKDGSTVIIGGLRKEEKALASESIPFLNKIPFLGFLFSSKTKSIDRTELLVMITPHIVSGDILTTGDERDFAYDGTKQYKDYSSFTEDTEYIPPYEAPGEMMKPYRDYREDIDFEEGEEEIGPVSKIKLKE